MSIQAIASQAVEQARKPASVSAASSKKKSEGVKEDSHAGDVAYVLDIKGQAISKIEQVRLRIAAGYYNKPEVIDALAERLMRLL